MFIVNLKWEFLGIPNYNNTGSKTWKFQVNSQQDFEFQGIPTQSTNNFP